MSRSDEYLESMLKDLGSAYYQTLQGEASSAEVAKAVESVRQASRQAGQVPRPRHGRWRVADVMTTDVITVGKHMPYKQVVRLLADNDLTSVPVVSGGRRVLGMVSEADVLRKEERFFGRLSAGLPRRTRHERTQAEALTVAELMTSPAITIHPDAPLGAAARLMNGHHIRRLPVVDPAGELLGIVSRRDLLVIFLRSDADIAAEVANALAGMPGEPVAVTVIDGEVTIGGTLPSHDLADAAIRTAWEVDGVVAVISALSVRE